MKKIISLLLFVVMLLSLVGCSTDGAGTVQHAGNRSSIVNTKRNYDKNDPEAVLDEIYNDFSDTTDALLDAEKKMFDKVGATYEEYVKNKGLIDDWIDLVKKESELLFERTQENSALYFDLISKDERHSDSEYMDEAIDAYYEIVHDDALDLYYDRLHNDAMDDLYDQYHNGIIDKAYKTLEYKEWSERVSESFKTWTGASSDIYSLWIDESSYAYGLWSDMRFELVYNNNSEVKDKIATYNAEYNAERKKKTEKKAILDKARDNAVDLDIQYEVLPDGNAAVVGYSGNGNRAIISSKYDGHQVVKIADSAFENCSGLQLISIWADLEEIGNNAFKNTGLLEITIPSETTIIGDHAFENCKDLMTASTWGNPNIGNYAFANCVKLEGTSISSDTGYVGDHAYDGCENLESVVLWGVEIIGDYAFANCKSISQIRVPSETKSVGNHAFDGCTELSDVHIWSETAIGTDAFANCPKLEDKPSPRGTVLRVPGSNKQTDNASSASASQSARSEIDESEPRNLVNGMRPEFIEAMNSYEAFYDSYIEVLNKYSENPTNLTILTEYMDLLSQAEEMDEKFNAWNDGTMNDAETSYFIQVNSRIMQKLANAY